ncbi:MAG: hypothetical protein IJT50_13300 [Lentisphaeria bacterium]|nr:hypothetical protein [Lentisphaeria bacterium]
MMTTTSVPVLPDPESRTPHLGVLDFLLYTFLLLWCVSPPLNYSLFCRLGALAAIALLAMRIMLKAAASKGNRWLIITFPLLIAIVTGLSLVFHFFIYVINTLIFLSMSVCAWNTYFTPPSPTQRRLFLTITFAVCLFWMYRTYSVLGIDPHAMRAMIRASEESMYYASLGAGGYGFLYALVLMFPAGLGVVTNRKEPASLRILALVFCVFTAVLTSKSGYFLALLLLIFSILFFIINQFAKNRVIILGFVLVFGVIGLVFADDILEFLIRGIDVPGIRRKLHVVQQMLNNDVDVEGSEFANRSERYTRDIQLILSSPIWGKLSFDAVGKHSHLLDFAAMFGLPMAFFYVHFCWRTLKNFINRHNSALSTCILTAIFLLSMNSLTYQFGGALFILLPIFASGIKDTAEADGQETGKIEQETKGA